jgi:hypothetical protein
MDARTRKRATFALGVLCGALVVIAACSTTLQGTLAIVTGPDNGFTMPPQPTSLLVQLIDQSGAATTIANVGLPTDGGVTLPSQPGSNVDIIQVTGFDDAGDAVVSGSTIPLALDQLSGLTLNLFVQRTGQFSRLPSLDGGTATLTGPLSSTPILTTLFSRYLLIADGTGKSTATQIYDTLTWQVDPSPPPLPIKPLSLAYVDTYTGSDASIDGSSPIAALLTLGSNGTASWLDLTDSTSADAEVTLDASIPPGGQLSDVTGGQTVVTPSGMLYIVGATRQTGKPTTTILRISTSGVLSWVSLTTPRLGAAAAYVPYLGLYVFGGSASGDAGAQANGVEFVSDTAPSATSPNPGLPPDTTTGAGAVAFDDNHVVLAGGVTPKGKPAPVRFYTVSDLSSPGSDAGTTWPALPVTLTSAQVFALTTTSSPQGTYSAVVVGNASSGAASAYLLTPTSVTPIQFQVSRTHARAIILPNGSLGVVGGDSGTLESFIR